MSVGLRLFDALCEVGNALEALRDVCEPAEPAWVALTDLLLVVDSAVDLLVHSTGIGDDDD